MNRHADIVKRNDPVQLSHQHAKQFLWISMRSDAFDTPTSDSYRVATDSPIRPATAAVRIGQTSYKRYSMRLDVTIPAPVRKFKSQS